MLSTTCRCTFSCQYHPSRLMYRHTPYLAFAIRFEICPHHHHFIFIRHLLLPVSSSCSERRRRRRRRPPSVVPLYVALSLLSFVQISGALLVGNGMYHSLSPFAACLMMRWAPSSSSSSQGRVVGVGCGERERERKGRRRAPCVLGDG